MLYPDSCVTGPERSVTQDAGAGETDVQQRAQQDWAWPFINKEHKPFKNFTFTAL